MPRGFLESTRKLNNFDRFSAAQIQQIRRAYYACISQVDYNLGLLFARMRELGLLKNTWIIFTSDHGEMLGDHHMGAKSVFFEGSAHVPLLVRPPATSGQSDARAGSVDGRLACLADVLPSVLKQADIAAPATDGLDWLGHQQREHLIGTCGPYHSVIARNWKFHFCQSGAAQLLFNLQDDPMETRDLLEAAPEKASAMRAMLVQSLEQRQHPSSANGVLVSSGDLANERAQRAQAWPGFHSRGDQNCDLLH